MKNYLKQYFEELKNLYLKEFGTNPTTPYFDNCSLFDSKEDEDGYAEWIPLEIEKIDIKNKEKLNDELIEFYSSYYYLVLRGTYKDIHFDFGIDMYSNELINKFIDNAINDGEYYFKSDNYILIATACMDGNDDILVFYDVNDEKVFLYDQDLEEKIGNVFELKEIIKNLRPDI